MSLISRIGRIFGEQEKKKISIDDAIKIIENQRNEKIASIIDESYSYASQIYSEIQILKGMISAFKNIKIEEKKAKASNDVKDRFCLYSEKQLSAIERPEKDLDNIKEFLEKTERTFASLGGLTPKQMMHIGFFFKGEISAISRKTILINEFVLKAKRVLDNIREYENFYRIREEIESFEQKFLLTEKEKRSIENASERLESDMKNIENDIESIDTSKLNEAEKEFSGTKSAKSSVEQELIFHLSVEKMLKKLRYDKDLSDSMLDAYVRSPIKALIEDNEMKIFQFTKQIIELSQKLKVDAKNMLKLNRILEEKDYIKKKRKELIELVKDLELKKNKLNNIKDIIEEKRNKLEISKASIEAQLSDNHKMLEKVSKDLNDLRKNIEVSRSELKMIAERLTDAELE